MMLSVASTVPAVLESANTIQPLLQSPALQACISVDAQMVTGVALRNASLRATANAPTRLFVIATVRLLAENCRYVGVAIPMSIATTAIATMSSLSEKPC
jgi:hypothetical protein